MCGRYTSTSSLADLAEVFEVDEVRTASLPARYNVAPTLDVYAVAVRRRREPENGPRRALGTFRWGLVPSWAKNPSVGNRMINARAEGLAGRPAFQAALARRRCLIPADAFYEWQPRISPDGRPAGKLPYAIRRRDGVSMAFAGLWEVWWPPAREEAAAPAREEVADGEAAPVDRARPDGQPLRTCTIVTTRANRLLAPIHGRMPVVLDRGDWDTWLDPESELPALERLLRPAPSEWLEAFPVGTLVNDVRRDGPELLEPRPRPPTG
jgi:putative SOS response-associated peptidase YedK